MKLRELRLLADQNIRAEVLEWLADQDVQILSCGEVGLERAPDDQIVAWAYREQMVILTHDTDFGMLAVLRRQPHHGIVLVRPGVSDRAIVTAQLAQVLDIDVPAGRWILTVDERDGRPRSRMREG